MNKSYSKIRHIQNSNILLENKLLLEYDFMATWDQTMNNAKFASYKCTWDIPAYNNNNDIKDDNTNQVYLYPNGTYISYKDAGDESKITDSNYSTGTFSCIVNRLDNTQKIKLTPNQQDAESSEANKENKADTSPATQSTTNTSWASLPTKVSTIQKSLNITPSSQMDQATINAIMNKLNSGAKVETQKPTATTQTKNSDY